MYTATDFMLGDRYIDVLRTAVLAVPDSERACMHAAQGEASPGGRNLSRHSALRTAKKMNWYELCVHARGSVVYFEQSCSRSSVHLTRAYVQHSILRGSWTQFSSPSFQSFSFLLGFIIFIYPLARTYPRTDRSICNRLTIYGLLLSGS